jgi:bacillithiol synthase
MDCTCVRQTELPNATALFTDYLYRPERLRDFYPRPEHDLASVEEAAREAAAMPDDRRAALVEALRPLNEGSAALEALARPGTVAVVTGQQVGLFSGPCYTIYKALTAVRLARELSAAGVPAVPVFWLATEDHDFAEVDHCWVFDAAHRPIRLEARGAQSWNQPVGGVPLAAPPVDELRTALRDFPFGEEVAAEAAAAYAPGRTMGEAFAVLLKRLLKPYDLVYVDPMAPAVRRLAAPALRAAVENAPELSAALLERNRRLEEAGYHAQVHVEERTSLVFLLENGRRMGLARHGADYLINGRRIGAAELADRAHELSPNALLRPVVQDSMLPTAAYVGGPAELAYLAQSEVLYRRLLGRMPAAKPRAGFTLLDARSRKLMDRFELRLPDFFHGYQALRERIALKLAPPALKRVVEETRATVQGAIDRLAEETAAFDPTLAAAIAKSRSKMLYQLAKSERKIGRETLARDERAERDAAYVYGLVYPERRLQERLYSMLPFLARHGLDLVESIGERIHLDCPDHQLVAL